MDGDSEQAPGSPKQDEEELENPRLVAPLLAHVGFSISVVLYLFIHLQCLTLVRIFRDMFRIRAISLFRICCSLNSYVSIHILQTYN